MGRPQATVMGYGLEPGTPVGCLAWLAETQALEPLLAACQDATAAR